MQFTIERDHRIYVVPQPIQENWRGFRANMINDFTSEEQSFLELFNVHFSVIIPRFPQSLESGTDAWIPQAYSSSESGE